jgi:hypothetical protein
MNVTAEVLATIVGGVMIVLIGVIVATRRIKL